MTIVHQGRGGSIEVDGVRHAIEHVEDGRFAIHLEAGQSSRERAKHTKELEALCAREPGSA